MPKVKKEFKIVTESGSQHGRSIQQLYSNYCGETVTLPSNSETQYACLQNGFYPKILPSDISDIKNKIYLLIKEKKYDELTEFLQFDFIYPQKLSSRSEHSGTYPDYVSSSYETFYVRNLMEKLFLEHRPFFHFLILSVIRQKDEKLYHAIIKALDKSGLSNQGLFDFDNKMKNNLLIQLRELEAYGAIIKADNPEDLYADLKNKSIRELSTVLFKRVKTKSVNQQNSLANKFENLEFKLDLESKLHDKDEILAHHRGYKKIITNILTILFTATIANWINKKRTGNFLFFNKTSSEEKIDAIKQIIFKPGMSSSS